MSKLIQLLTALRDSMANADMDAPDGLANVFSEFLDISEGSELIDASKPDKDKGMKTLIENVARHHAKDPALSVVNMRVLQHVPTGLFHGGFFAGKYPGSFFFFKAADQGIVAFFSGGSMMDYYRITATVLPPGTVIGRKRLRMN